MLSISSGDVVNIDLESQSSSPLSWDSSTGLIGLGSSVFSGTGCFGGGVGGDCLFGNGEICGAGMSGIGSRVGVSVDGESGVGTGVGVRVDGEQAISINR
jgi:hypothetical protein